MSQSDADEPMDRRGFLRAAATGAAGTAAAVGAVGTAAGQETTGGSSGSSGGSGGGTKTVDLVDYAFNPGTDSPLQITPGTTVKFDWKTGGHNIHVDSQPDGANWKGHEAIEDSGFTTTHTFKTKGKYHYWCVPHKSLGMVADIQVTENVQSGGSGGGDTEPPIPKQALTLGIAATATMASTLGLAYVFMRYGGDYGEEPAES